MALGVGEAVEVEVAFAGDEAVAQEGGGEAGFGKAAGGGHLRELYLDGRLDAGLAEEVHGAVVQVVAAAQQDEGLGGEVFKVDARTVGREVAVFCQADFPIFVVGIPHRHRGKIPTFSGPCQEAGSTTASCRMRACSIR